MIQTAIRVVKTGPPVDAPEWAMRRGWAIAQKHVSDFDVKAALAKDIAEALYNATPAHNGGRWP
jgi:hypothetical protein